MRLLDRYLLRELLIPLGYCLCGFLIFWIAFDLFSELAAFQQEKLKPPEIALYYLVVTPKLLQEIILPAALLLALLYALTNHARYHELTAMRAAGISLGRLSLPYVGVGLLLSLASAVMNEFWVPESAGAAQRILTRYITPAVPGPQRYWEHDVVFN